jgi:ABC-type sugar transport system permease subunit
VAPYLFILPFFLLFLPFGAGSIILAVGIAFVDWPLGRPAEFVGVAKFAAVLRDPVFYTGMYNTFRMLVAYLLVLMPLAIFVAVSMAQLGRRSVNVVQLIIFAPITMSLIAVSVIFGLLYDDKVGMLNGLLGFIGIAPVQFLTSAEIAPWAIVAMRIWRVLGYYAIMLFAGLQTIPDELYEAAAIDGANWWQRLWSVTLPMLKPVTMFVLVAASVGAWEVFAEPNVLTEGGPARATYTAIMYIFDVSFGRFDLGRGAAAGVLLAIAIIATTGLVTLLMRDKTK